VEELEKESLGIMSELFECTVDDLKISRFAFFIFYDPTITLGKQSSA